MVVIRTGEALFGDRVGFIGVSMYACLVGWNVILYTNRPSLGNTMLLEQCYIDMQHA